MRETQHGHNNTIQAILHLIDVDSDNEKIFEVLSNYTNELQKSLLPSSLLRLENKLLAALLYHKHCQAVEQGMTIHFHIADPMCRCRASEFELVEAEKHGLGLSILQNIVKKHNGALMISNALHDELQYISFTLLL